MKKFLLSIIILILLTGCANPLPESRLNYVGDWQSKEMRLLILADGSVSYKRIKKGGSNTINMPLKEFADDDFVVGIGFLSTTFDVSEPPHVVNGLWRMTVDGVRLTKVTKSSMKKFQDETESDNTYLRTVYELRIKLKNLVMKSRLSAKDQFKNRPDILALKDEIDSMMNLLTEQAPKNVSKNLREIKRDWRLFNEEVGTLLLYHQDLNELHKHIKVINNRIPTLTDKSDELVGRMIDYQATPGQTYIATRQLMLTQRIALNLRVLSTYEIGSESAFDRFGRDISLFNRIISSMMNGGDRKLQIEHIQDAGARKKLNEINDVFQIVKESSLKVLELSPQLILAIEAIDEIRMKSNELDAKIVALLESGENISKANTKSSMLVAANNWCDNNDSKNLFLNSQNSQNSLLKQVLFSIDNTREHIREFALGESDDINRIQKDIKLLVLYEDLLIDGSQECGIEKLIESRASNSIKVYFAHIIDDFSQLEKNMKFYIIQKINLDVINKNKTKVINGLNSLLKLPENESNLSAEQLQEMKKIFIKLVENANSSRKLGVEIRSAVNHVDKMGRNTAKFGRMLRAMSSRSNNRIVKSKLENIYKPIGSVIDSVTKLLAVSPNIFEVSDHYLQIELLNNKFSDEVNQYISQASTDG